MANPNIPRGLLPYNSPWMKGQPVVTEHELLSSNAEIGIGSPVVLVNGGIDLATAGTGNYICGISAEYKAANSDGKIKIWSNPYQLFIGQTDDGTGTATAEAAIGLNINFVGTGVSGLYSTAELDEDSADTGATIQFHIIALAKTFRGGVANAHGEFNQLIVMPNYHQFREAAGI